MFSKSEFMFAIGQNFLILMLSRVIGGMRVLVLVMPGGDRFNKLIFHQAIKSKKLWLHVKGLSIQDSF